jgi:hypothetical protein
MTTAECRGCDGPLGFEGKHGLCLSCQESIDRLVVLHDMTFEIAEILAGEQVRKARAL